MVDIQTLKRRTTRKTKRTEVTQITNKTHQQQGRRVQHQESYDGERRTTQYQGNRYGKFGRRREQAADRQADHRGYKRYFQRHNLPTTAARGHPNEQGHRTMELEARLTQLAERMEAAMAANEQESEDKGKYSTLILASDANPSYVKQEIGVSTKLTTTAQAKTPNGMFREKKKATSSYKRGTA